MGREKTVALVRRLFERTNDGELAWEEAKGADGFHVAFPQYAIVIARREARDEWGSASQRYVLSILNAQDRVVEEIGHEDLAGSLQNPEKIMESLYEGARRRAMGVEEAFDSILSSLGSSTPRKVAPGPPGEGVASEKSRP